MQCRFCKEAGESSGDVQSGCISDGEVGEGSGEGRGEGRGFRVSQVGVNALLSVDNFATYFASTCANCLVQS